MKRIVGYRTENRLNGKYYYGVRTLISERDPYLGSGKRLQEAIQKYGKENFIRIDLVEFSTFTQALEWERKIITEDLVNDRNCYNLKLGGAGGSIPWTDDRKKTVRESGTYKKTEQTREKLSKVARKRFENVPGTFSGKTHTFETKKKLSEQRKGKPGKNKGKKLSLSQERLGDLRKPKSQEVKSKISRSLCKLTDEQITYLKEEFIDIRGERTKLCKKWGINLDQIARIIGRTKV